MSATLSNGKTAPLRTANTTMTNFNNELTTQASESSIIGGKKQRVNATAAELGTKTFVEEDLGDDSRRGDSENPMGEGASAANDKKKKKKKNKNKKKPAVNNNEASGPNNATDIYSGRGHS